MTLHKSKLTEAERQAEIKALDLLPPAEAMRKTDAVLKKMLNTPPERHSEMVLKKKAKKPSKKK